MDADVCLPVRNDYLHSILVPEYLNEFCQELDNYKSRLIGDCFVSTLAIAHLSLQDTVGLIPTGLVGTQPILRRVLIWLGIFYHLLYKNEEMSEWAGWEAAQMEDVVRGRYLFVWKISQQYHESAEAIHQLVQHHSDQHLWADWLFQRLDCIDGDVSVEIVPTRTKWLNTSVNLFKHYM